MTNLPVEPISREEVANMPAMTNERQREIKEKMNDLLFDVWFYRKVSEIKHEHISEVLEILRETELSLDGISGGKRTCVKALAFDRISTLSCLKQYR